MKSVLFLLVLSAILAIVWSGQESHERDRDRHHNKHDDDDYHHNGHDDNDHHHNGHDDDDHHHNDHDDDDHHHNDHDDRNHDNHERHHDDDDSHERHHHHKKCIDMPRKVIPNLDDIIAQPAKNCYYALKHKWDCSNLYSSISVQGNKCSDGTAHAVLPANKLFTLPFKACPHNKRCFFMFDAKTGLNQTWHYWDYELNGEHPWSCIYSCEANGKNFQDFACFSSDDSNLKKIKKIVERARRIRNGKRIHNARKGCPPSEECSIQ